VKSVIMTLS